MSTFRGRARVWGTANPRYWAGLDPKRREKTVGLVLDLGRTVKPLITPEDPDRCLAVIRTHSAARIDEERGARAPII